MKLSTVIIVFVFLGVAAFWIWYLFFNIFEVRFFAYPTGREVTMGSMIKFIAEPVNALGKKAVWRKVNFKVDVLEGSELIEESEEKEQKRHCFVVKSKPGKVKFRLSSDLAHSPSDFEFEIK
jgi:hypothetical protein